MRSSFLRGGLVLLFAVSIGAAIGAAAPPEGGYHLIKKVTLGGEGFWDYLKVDSDARRLYISRGTHVMVVDADN